MDGGPWMIAGGIDERRKTNTCWWLVADSLWFRWPHRWQGDYFLTRWPNGQMSRWPLRWWR